MPFAPPKIGGRKGPKKPWAPAPGRVDKRKRGRAGQRDRAEMLALEPFCRKCLERRKRVATDVIDHILPLAWGGSDTRGNKQGLCDPCHEEKSTAERAIDAAQRRRFD